MDSYLKLYSLKIRISRVEVEGFRLYYMLDAYICQ